MCAAVKVSLIVEIQKNTKMEMLICRGDENLHMVHSISEQIYYQGRYIHFSRWS